MKIILIISVAILSVCDCFKSVNSHFDDDFDKDKLIAGTFALMDVDGDGLLTGNELSLIVHQLAQKRLLSLENHLHNELSHQKGFSVNYLQFSELAREYLIRRSFRDLSNNLKQRGGFNTNKYKEYLQQFTRTKCGVTFSVCPTGGAKDCLKYYKRKCRSHQQTVAKKHIWKRQLLSVNHHLSTRHSPRQSNLKPVHIQPRIALKGKTKAARQCNTAIDTPTCSIQLADDNNDNDNNNYEQKEQMENVVAMKDEKLLLTGFVITLAMTTPVIFVGSVMKVWAGEAELSAIFAPLIITLILEIIGRLFIFTSSESD